MRTEESVPLSLAEKIPAINLSKKNLQGLYEVLFSLLFHDLYGLRIRQLFLINPIFSKIVFDVIVSYLFKEMIARCFICLQKRENEKFIF